MNSSNDLPVSPPIMPINDDADVRRDDDAGVDSVKDDVEQRYIDAHERALDDEAMFDLHDVDNSEGPTDAAAPHDIDHEQPTPSTSDVPPVPAVPPGHERPTRKPRQLKAPVPPPPKRKSGSSC